MLIPVSRALSEPPIRPGRQCGKIGDQINCEAVRELAVACHCRSMPIAMTDTPGGGSGTRPYSLLADGLLEAGCVKFGQFTLKSGLESPIYLDLRQLVSYPALLAQVAAAYVPILRGLSFDRLAALPYAALPIGAAISLQTGWPLVYPRKEAKAYGTKAEIEGLFSPGERAVVVDDLTTTGGSKFEAIEKLTAAGLQVSDVVVLIDRQSGAPEAWPRRATPARGVHPGADARPLGADGRRGKG